MAVKVVVLIMLGLVVVTVARIEGVVGRAAMRAEATEKDMSTITFTKTLDDGIERTVIALTVTQHPGETTQQFMARARAEWAAFCAEFGG